ncbi:WhiB family transcriptional regulator [Pimelobacter simplex]|uniref:WhiB family transcriptional regulator n=1 Tax=Nocardioides simplex TaxID=2045 RepID=UPI003AAB0D59
MRERFFEPEDWLSDWSRDAACATQADPAAFMSDAAGAPVVCLRCPVLRQCHDQATANDERSGVWGGLDRRRIN